MNVHNVKQDTLEFSTASIAVASVEKLDWEGPVPTVTNPSRTKNWISPKKCKSALCNVCVTAYKLSNIKRQQ